eukprot:6189861-Pleurochrysis_carterae.AAC.1
MPRSQVDPKGRANRTPPMIQQVSKEPIIAEDAQSRIIALDRCGSEQKRGSTEQEEGRQRMEAARRGRGEGTAVSKSGRGERSKRKREMSKYEGKHQEEEEETEIRMRRGERE